MFRLSVLALDRRSGWRCSHVGEKRPPIARSTTPPGAASLGEAREKEQRGCDYASRSTCRATGDKRNNAKSSDHTQCHKQPDGRGLNLLVARAANGAVCDQFCACYGTIPVCRAGPIAISPLSACEFCEAVRRVFKGAHWERPRSSVGNIAARE